MSHLEYTTSNNYIIITILLLLLLAPIFSSAAQPRNETSQTRTGPTPEEMEKMDEILKKLEEEDRKHPLFSYQSPMYTWAM